MDASTCQEIRHLTLSLPDGPARGEDDLSLLRGLQERNQLLEEQLAEQKLQLADMNDALRQAKDELARMSAAPRQLEEALRQSEAHYRLLTENAPDVVWRLDSNYRFTYISPSDKRLRGYRADEVIGHHIAEIFSEEGLAEVRKLGLLRLEAERRGERMGIVTFEAQHRCKGGSWIWAEISSAPEFDDQGNIIGFFGISREFTERKQAEVLLQQAKVAAEEANKAKSEFLALVSHEIRTPLNSLVGFSSMARATTDPVKLDQYHAILEQSSRSLMDLVNNILDMSKIEAGRLECESVPVNLRQLTVNLEAHYRHLTAQKRLGFRVFVEETAPAWVLGDPVRLRQILANILANAVKFTEEGEISCSVRIPPPAAGAPSLLRFQVQDTGIGIPEQKLSQLFRPFQQMDPSISRKYGGSGLGLAIVKSLVVMMGGSITVDSQEGAGSCFSVDLPYQECEAVPDALLAHPVFLAKGMVLVVEDNRFNRQLFEDLLTGWGQQVILAEDGLQGLRLLEQHHFDLVLLDIRMPGIDGIEVARRIRRREQELSRPPVLIIAVTADLDTATRNACCNAGINVTLAKPVIPEELARALAVHGEGLFTLSAQPQPLLNQQTRKGVGSDPGRLRRYLELLAQDLDDELHSLGTAVEQGDRQRLSLSAHTLKGLCGQLSNREPAELAARLQQNAPCAPLEWLEEMVEQLRSGCRFAMAQEERA